MSDSDSLLFAFLLDGRGGGRPLDWEGIRGWRPDDGVLWVHLDRTAERARQWVSRETGIDPAVCETLLTPVANRPRMEHMGDGMLGVLRGINQNQGAEPDDMVGLHMWVDPTRIITLRRRRLMVGQQLHDMVQQGRGPTGPSRFVAAVADRMMRNVGDVIERLDDRADEMQAELLEDGSRELRSRLRHLRQEAINYRRYLAPQRDALSRLQTDHPDWLEARDLAYLRETADRTLRMVEDLDSIRERAAIAQEELNNRQADQMNRTMYLLTLVAALLLPPSLLTGLFGINVAGMPGVDAEWAFYVILIAIPVLAVIELVVLRWLKWI